ncbi:type II secretion system protein [Pseudoalteromonas sp. McH1-7]|uniref:type II secretion system protein n=1 Tax=unclassified Pseudoalteromonas TaxID=194690 RepID=UPI0015927E47|nr:MULTISPECIES: type II secretion system protein [unclassified Pseudoalteromonas]NUZ10696.1 type II secretion system protein [Pseudoalteromonas sp. McH1-7]USD29055.1 type II secretion system protein [Pseudoalteromonas sp. SCSIO 43201]
MMFHSKSSQGFSLIELMIVLAIMGVAMSLTGGLVVKAVSKRTEIIEIKKVENIFKRVMYKSYFSGLETHISIVGNTVIVHSSENEKEVIKFEVIQFVPEDFIINTKAQIFPNKYGIIDPIKGPLFYSTPAIFDNYAE